MICTFALLLLRRSCCPLCEVLAHSRRMDAVETVAILKDLAIQARLHIESIVKAQCLLVVEMKTTHEFCPFLVVLVGAAVYYPSPYLMSIFL